VAEETAFNPKDTPELGKILSAEDSPLEEGDLVQGVEATDEEQERAYQEIVPNGASIYEYSPPTKASTVASDPVLPDPPIADTPVTDMPVDPVIPDETPVVTSAEPAGSDESETTVADKNSTSIVFPDTINININLNGLPVSSAGVASILQAIADLKTGFATAAQEQEDLDAVDSSLGTLETDVGEPKPA
jgi:hypothetical protein